ncbi:MAG: hypothetical protein NXI31_07595 [bacterium]|nr:hypothetical protein [bacterium]
MICLPGLLLVACATGSPVDRLPETRDLRSAEPAPFRIAVTPLDVREGITLASAGQAEVAWDRERVRATLVEDLEELRAASVIEAVDGDGFDAGADLVLRPRLSGAEFAYLGSTSDGWLSSLLWITTWVGGLFVADSDYEAGVQIDWEVVNPHSGQTIANLAGNPRSMRLGFFDRNDLWSLGTLQSLVVPPVFTVDDGDRTTQTLFALGVAHSAGEMTRFLKTGMNGEERELVGELRLEFPRNGGRVAATCRMRGAVLAHGLVTELAMFLNGETVALLGPDELPPRSRQQVGARTFRVELPDAEIALAAGRNQVSVEFVTGGRRTSRTVVLHRDDHRSDS